MSDCGCDCCVVYSDGCDGKCLCACDACEHRELLEAEARIKELEEALRDALEGFEDGSSYKSDYLREKHGDPEEIARLRALLNEGSE